MTQMTPIGLVYELAARIRAITRDLRMEEPDGGGGYFLRAPNVWEQNLPEKLYEGENDPADYPFVLVMLGGGAGVTDGKAPSYIGILVGGYDDGEPIGDDPNGVRDRQGWLIPAAMVWRICNALMADPVIGPFMLDVEGMTWELPGQEQPAPQWFGTINTTWTLPVPEQHFGLENMTTRITPPCKAAMSDDINTFVEGT